MPILRLLGGIFFDRRFLKGRYFEDEITGWKWVLRSIFFQKILGFNRHIPWPVSPFILINNSKNIIFDIDDINNFQMIGNYFQNFNGKIYIGKSTWIGPNVGIITANHHSSNLQKWECGEDVIIGNHCWIGMNSMILPGVILGDHTIVGAGSIVTKSFLEGNALIAGNPAKIIKCLK
ncbi:MAG: acyltransferase [Methanotrichaceae archaeon]|nr:acyltransferase [Methanotrichaceae archaeon]